MEYYSVSDIKRTIPYGITYMWNLRKATNELISKTEIELQTWKRNLWLPGAGVGINWKTGTDTYILLYLTQITDKVLLFSTGNPL